MLLRAIVVTTALACIYALPTPGTIVPERESEMDGAVVPLAMSLLSTVRQNTGYTLEAIQVSALRDAGCECPVRLSISSVLSQFR